MAGLQATINTANANPGCDLWGSVPCTPWCRWHSINIGKLGPQFEEKLQAQRRKNLKIVRNFKILAKTRKENGGNIHFEWPAYNDGWQQPEVEKMLAELNTMTTIFHGCDVKTRMENPSKSRGGWKPPAPC